MTGRKLGGFALAATMLVAACGGPTPTAGPGGATAGPGATPGSGQPTPAPTGAPVVTPGNQGGGAFTGDPCSLLTAADLERVTGVKNAVGASTPMVNFVGGCSWNGDDSTLAAVITVSATPDTQSVWQVYATIAEAEALSGIGDAAIYYQGALLLLKGGTIVTIGSGPLLADPATRKASAIELGKIVAGKL